MSEEIKTKIGLTLDQGMLFKCDLGEMKVKDCYIDEEHPEEVDMLGPNPSRMLGLAVIGCLSASFIFCLKKRNFNVDDLDAEAEITIAKNKKGFWRVKKISVNIDVKVDNKNEKLRKRIDQCLKKFKDDKSFFEQFCTVTESVRSGIEVEVNLNI
ncbi:unnamed protein product [marine sediment metagenome]|uniref:OsmC family protein n=1 Tax=marine sediment metagenome TaxID=412755 RepID=X0VDL1_9ZZZZ